MKKVLLPAVLLLAAISLANADDAAVRIRFGLNDVEVTKWDGSVNVSAGRVTAVSGWRFAGDDAVVDASGWTASTRRAQVQRGLGRGRAALRPQPQQRGAMQENGVIVNLSGVSDDAIVEVKTARGEFSFKVADVPFGKVIERLDGAVDVERVAFSTPLTQQRTDEDFPAAATTADGSVYVAYVSFTPGLDRDRRARRLDKEPENFSDLATPPGGDQVWLRTLKNGLWSEPLAVTAGKGDIYKCAVTVDGQKRPWVFWSENRDGNFDIWARALDGSSFSEPQRLSSDSGNDVAPVAATDAQGRVWAAWQGARDGAFRILARHQQAEGGWSPEEGVSTQTRNCWAPAMAAAKDGRIAVAWDTYDKGDYDVWLREFDPNGKPGEPRAVANTPRYEARPSVTYDAGGRVWIAWEESGATWAKNFGALVKTGTAIYAGREIGMRVLTANGEWLATEGGFAAALPGAKPRRGARQLRLPGPEGEPSDVAIPAAGAATYNNLSRIVADRDGRIWLLARTRQSDFGRTPLGTVWMEYAAYYDGNKWVGPLFIPHSDNLLYNVPAVVAAPEGGLLLAHSSDHRQDRRSQAARGARGGLDALGAASDPFDNDLFISRLAPPGAAAELALKPAAKPPAAKSELSEATKSELAAIARCREFRLPIGGKELRLLRGEFHRHTEISGDGANDGPLEDMWRYALDVASMDWIGNGDHDNGNGREYPWWLIQKTTDAYRLPKLFEPMFTYERSVAYPEGHRNVIFAKRGIRTLPRLPITNAETDGHAPDTQMLYKYLRFFDGICASHTSATQMGTDWRDNDVEREPFVEIYQGARQNYELPGAPRSPSEDDALGGWRPKGFINLALQKGYRLAFESSSDHVSTHISYAMIYAEEPSREGILAAMKKRHTYAATDNIIADFQCMAGGVEHMMGEEFSAKEAPALKVKLIGTAPFAKVTILKDSEPVHVVEPKTAEVEFAWTDPNPSPGRTSYYYVRGEQADGELVWASPMWIALDAKAPVARAARHSGAAGAFALLLVPLGVALVMNRRR